MLQNVQYISAAAISFSSFVEILVSSSYHQKASLPTPSASKIAMCNSIHAQLSCGHSTHAAVIQCGDALNKRPWGSPHDDGRHVCCQPGEVLTVDENAYCEACFAQTVRGLILTLWQSCQSGVLSRMGRALLELMGSTRCRRQGAREQGLGHRSEERIDLLPMTAVIIIGDSVSEHRHACVHTLLHLSCAKAVANEHFTASSWYPYHLLQRHTPWLPNSGQH